MVEEHIGPIDNILAGYRSAIGTEYQGYRNHVCRMVSFCLALSDLGEDATNKLIIAGCFHDIGIWTGPTFDYLPPSIVAAEQYLKETGFQAWIPEISEMIDQHHKLTAYKNAELVEVFRKGDLVDFSLGSIKSGLSSDFVRDVRKRFPNEGFHWMLAKRAAKWVCRHPLNPLPVLKF